MNLEEYLQEHYSPTATGSYQLIIDRFLSFTGDQAATATYQDILAYISYLRKAGKHPKTIRNTLYAIRIYYRWLVETGQRKDHPCQHLYLKDKINRAIPIEELYTPEQLENLLANYRYRALKNHSAKKEQIEQRNKVVISLLICQALTVLEITRLDVADVNLEKAEIHIQSNKKNKGRTLPLKGNQVLLIHRYVTEIRPELSRSLLGSKCEALITNYRGKRITIQSVSGLFRYHDQPFSPQKIRQSVIAHLLKQGNDLRIVQVFAGHRNSSSTEAYRQTGLEELKASINKLHPLQ